MKKRDFYKKIKQYPELFDEVEQDVYKRQIVKHIV